MNDTPKLLTEIRYTRPELDKYYPERDNVYAGRRLIANALLPFGAIIALIGGFALFNNSIPTGLAGWFFGMGILSIGFAMRDYINKDINRIVAEKQFKENQSQMETIEMTQKATGTILKNTEYLKKVSDRGDWIVASAGAIVVGQGAVIVQNSTVSGPIVTNPFYSTVGGSFDKHKDEDAGLAAAIKQIAGCIDLAEGEHAKEGKEYYELFLKELDGGKNKRTLSAFWEQIVKFVPDVATLAESAAKLTALFL